MKPHIHHQQMRFTNVDGRVCVDVEDLMTLLRDFESNRRQHRRVRSAAGDAATFLREAWLALTDPRG